MTLYRYSFPPDVPPAEVQGTLLLAYVAIEGLHGEAQARLDAGSALTRTFGPCVIDASTPVGRDLAKVFTAFLRREFGEDSFRVEAIQPIPPQSQPTTPEAK